MNPKIIKCMAKGYNESEREKALEIDHANWMLGHYFQSALTVVVEQALVGRKAKAKYIERPILEMAQKENEDAGLSEEEKIRQTKFLFNRLKVLQANFELAKGGK